MKFHSRSRLILTLSLLSCLVFATVGFDACGKKCGDSCKDQPTAEARAECEKKCKAQSKANFVAYSKDVLAAFKSARPHIASLKPSLLPAWDRSIPIAEKLLAAAQASDHTQAAQLIADLFPVVEEAFAAFTGNTAVLTVLALANIGLHFYLNHLPEPPRTARMGPTERRLREFKGQPTWGCEFKPDKCQAAGLSH